MKCKHCSRNIRESWPSGYEHGHDGFMICVNKVEYSEDGRIIKSTVATPKED